MPISPAAESSRAFKVADPRSVSRWNTAMALSRIVFDWSVCALSIGVAFGEDAPEGNVGADLFMTSMRRTMTLRRIISNLLCCHDLSLLDHVMMLAVNEPYLSFHWLSKVC